MNMNRQGKLYSQGYCPVIYTVPGSNKWERLQEKPAFDVRDQRCSFICLLKCLLQLDFKY